MCKRVNVSAFNICDSNKFNNECDIIKKTNIILTNLLLNVITEHWTVLANGRKPQS